MKRWETWRAGPLEITEVGDGPRVGYLHGMVPVDDEMSFLECLVAGGFAVAAPCLPGYGSTATSADLRTMHDWVAALSEILDIAHVSGTPVVASSVGAMLALELAAIRPEAFSELILIGPLGLWRDSMPVTDPFSTTLSGQRNLLTNDPDLTASFYEDQPGSDTVVRTIQRYTARTATASLVWPIPDFGLSQRIHRVTCPVTLIWGADDRIVPPAYADVFADCLVNLRSTHVIEGAGHLAELDAPEQVARIVTGVIGDE
jgi:pimeloyl-ACP methyl ester carboxylesterase